MTQNLTDIVDVLLSKLRTIATSETVVGQAVTVGNLTVIPVVKVSIGFGVGVGEGLPREGEKGRAMGSGGGTGGGLSVTPIAFITYDGEQVKLLSITKGRWESVVESIPEALKQLGIVKPKKDAAEKEGQ
ncbi:MAG: GerW family sporulation protein [bacterium]